MGPLWLDYQRNDPSRRRPGWLLLGAGLIAAVLVVGEYYSVADDRDEAQAQVDRLRQEAVRRTALRPPASATAGTPVRGGPSVQRWEALFSALEGAAGDSVTLLSLHPGANEIQISGEAKDFAASMDYLQRLQSTQGLANARLTQSEVVAENPRHPVRFALVADWRGGT
jgi:Tfp pilus assembly protein PilN